MTKAQEPCDVPCIMLVDSNDATAATNSAVLKTSGLTIVRATNGAAALQMMRTRAVACIVLDLGAPSGTNRTANESGLLREFRGAEQSPAVVVLTSDGSLSAAVECVRAGAFDYLVRPFSANRLIAALEAALASARPRAAPQARVAAVPRDSDFGGFVGRSKAMLTVYATITAAARSNASVFITGESGTGKELAAEALHAHSQRSNRALVALNCGAIPRDLMESTLFGHVKGSFTGATDNVEGAASRADGGTLFLDELGEMEPGLQTKLLRFIQTGCYQRVGDPKLRQADIRFVAATNRDPDAAIASGRLRADLFYRLCVVRVELPPLRNRGDDVIRIARRFLEHYAQLEGRSVTALSPGVEAALLADAWPGNVRELQNVIHSAIVLNDGPLLTCEMLPTSRFGLEALHCQSLSQAPGSGSLPGPFDKAVSASQDAIETLSAAERHYIEWAIGCCGGNLQAAARKLGISPSTIYRKKELWNREVSIADLVAA